MRAPGGLWPGATKEALAAELAGQKLVYPRWGLRDFFVTVALTAAAAAALGLTGLVWPNLPIALLAVLAIAVQWSPMVVWPWFRSRQAGNGVRIDFGLALFRSDIKPGLLGGLATIFLGALIGAITFALFGEFTATAGEVLGELSGQRFALIAFLFAIVVLAPLVEEFFFRGFVWAALAKRGVSPWWVTVVTAALFAVWHLEPVRMPLLFAMGIVLGYLRQKSMTLGPSIIAHAMVNSLSSVAIFSLW